MMSDASPLIQKIEQQFMRTETLPDFRPGDTVRVDVKIREGEKERIQAFEGVVISRNRGGNRESFTVRKISYGVGVERVFATNSPNIAGVELLTRGKVRQSRLYYLRGLSGKAARIKERAYDKSKSEGEKKVGRKKRGAHRKAEAVEKAPAEKKQRKPRKKKNVAPEPAPAEAVVAPTAEAAAVEPEAAPATE